MHLAHHHIARKHRISGSTTTHGRRSHRRHLAATPSPSSLGPCGPSFPRQRHPPTNSSQPLAAILHHHLQVDDRLGDTNFSETGRKARREFFDAEFWGIHGVVMGVSGRDVGATSGPPSGLKC